MTGYDAGEAFIRMVPTFEGVIERINVQATRWGASAGSKFASSFNERVRRETNVPVGPSQEQSRRQGQQAGRTFADSFKARVEAALRSLPDFNIGADATEADQKINLIRLQLEALRDARVGVDIDSAEATAQIDRLKAELEELGRESPDVAVQINTARASAELARIRAEIDELRTEDPEVDVDVDDHGSTARTTAEVNKLAASLIALSPLAIPVGAALVAGLAGAAGVIAAIAAGIGVLALGLSGVGSTIDLLNQRRQAIADQSGSSGGGGSSGRAQAQAERSLADARYNAAQQAITSVEQVKRARQSLADTERRLARQEIEDARTVAAAQRDVLDAAQAVHDAREQAQRDLEDAANAAADANLSQTQAQVDLADAQANLQRVNADWTATADDRKQAELDVAKAQQALVEAGQNAARATEDNNKAQKAGVDGAPSVVTALQRQKDAIAALHDARVKERQDAADGAREIARAEQDVTDALRSQQNQARSSAEAILNAQDAVASAMEQTGSSGSDQLAKINAQLAKVSPATLAFAKFWRNQMSPIFNGLKDKAAAGLLPAIERALKILKPLFKPFGEFIGSLSRTIGRLFVQLAKAFTDPFWTQFFAFLDRNLPRWLTQFGHIFGNLITGFAGIFQAFGPIINAIGGGLVDLAQRFADFATHLGRSAAFQSFLRYIRENGPIVADFFGNLFRIAGKLVTALAPLGHVLIVVLDGISKFLAGLSPQQLLLVVGAIATLVAVLGGPITAIVVAVTAAVGLLAANWDKLKGTLGPIIKAIGGALKRAFDGLRTAVGYITDAIKDHRKQFEALAGFLSKYVIPVLGWLAEHAFKLVGEYIAFVIRQAGFLIQISQDLVAAAKKVGEWFAGPFVDFFTGAWDKVTGAFSDAWDWVKKTWSKLWDGAKDIVTSPINAAKKLLDTVWDKLQDAFSATWRWVSGTWSKLWDKAKAIVTSPITAAKNALGDVWSDIKSAFRAVWDWVHDTFASLWGRATDLITAPITAAKRVLGGLWGDIKDGARTFVDGIKTIWDRLENIFKAPIRFVVNTVINGALIGAWNWVANKIPGIDVTIDPFTLPKGFATGGIYPGYTPGRDVGYVGVSGGEAIMRPEWTRAVGPDYVHAANAAARSGGEHGVHRFLGGFDAGGIVGSLNPLTYIDYIKDKITGPLRDLFDKFGTNDWTRMLEHLPLGLAEKMFHAIRHAVLSPVAGIAAGEAGIIGDILDALPGGDVTSGTGSVGDKPSPPVAQALGQQMAAKIGWTGPNWSALNNLWIGESGWRWNATGALTNLGRAYGIPQSLPGDKMAAAGPDWLTNAITQMRWGMGYIADRYRTPANAYSQWLARDPHWYDEGGLLEPGYTLAYNGTGQAEVIAPRQNFEELMGAGRREQHVSGELAITRDSLDNLGAFVDARVDDRRGFDAATGRAGG